MLVKNRSTVKHLIIPEYPFVTLEHSFTTLEHSFVPEHPFATPRHPFVIPVRDTWIQKKNKWISASRAKVTSGYFLLKQWLVKGLNAFAIFCMLFLSGSISAEEFTPSPNKKWTGVLMELPGLLIANKFSVAIKYIRKFVLLVIQ
ncbi:MAG: hypothetical protein LBF70_01815 [Holosporales bacterium]|jgi:hypothetical protein|nr:hypothetical protein [Holosporales bacterium]